jgi:hypothetical protein
MSEELLERLSRFTPDAGGLNRDALLFAAGRSSARPNRRWMSLAALLAGTHVLSLIVMWPRATPPARETTAKIVTAPVTPAPLEPRVSETLANSGIWSARHSLLEVEPEDRPTDNITLIDTEPPLRAFHATPSPLSN